MAPKRAKMSKCWEVASWTACTDWETVGKIAAEFQWVEQLLCTNLCNNNNKKIPPDQSSLSQNLLDRQGHNKFRTRMLNLNSLSSIYSIFWVVKFINLLGFTPSTNPTPFDFVS